MVKLFYFFILFLDVIIIFSVRYFHLGIFVKPGTHGTNCKAGFTLSDFCRTFKMTSGFCRTNLCFTPKGFHRIEITSKSCRAAIQLIFQVAFLPNWYKQNKQTVCTPKHFQRKLFPYFLQIRPHLSKINHEIMIISCCLNNYAAVNAIYGLM